MTNTQRFRAALAGSTKMDRLPAVEWASWWEETVDFWEHDGLAAGMSGEALHHYFQLDGLKQFWLRNWRNDCPKAKIHGAGILKNEADYENLLPFLYPQDSVSSIRGELEQAAKEQAAGDTVIWYTLDGFFWYPRELFGIEDHLFSFYDQPDLYHRICHDLLDWQLKMVEQIGRYCVPEFMTIAEDMSYNLGPMLSKELFYEFLAPYYRQLIPEIQRQGTKVFVDSDGEISQMIPWLLDCGVDGVLPLERQAGVDVGRLRREFPQMLMLGGFDKMCMLRGEPEIRQEFDRLLPVMQAGGYIPAMDHQTPPGTTVQNYRAYVRMLKEYGSLAMEK